MANLRPYQKQMMKSLDQRMKEPGFLKGGVTIFREQYPQLFEAITEAVTELELSEKMINIPWIKKISKSIPKTRFCCKTNHYDVTTLDTNIKKWVYYYNDGDIETVTMRAKL